MTTSKSRSRIGRPSQRAVAKALRDTDWAAIDAMSDAEIARRVAEDADAAPIRRDLKARIADGRAEVVRPIDVAAIRAKTRLSQERFARAVQISPHTLRNWEQGRRVPDGPARALLIAIDRAPDTVMALLRDAA